MENVDPLVKFSSKLGNSQDWGFGDDEYLKKQAFFAISAFGAGVSVSADLRAPGNWDSRQDNDLEQENNFPQLTSCLDYLWDLAESTGLADELMVVVGSDFSRTPHYNADNGKGHWPIGSYIIMEKGARYTNRLVDGTNELQNALAVDPKTLKPSTFGTKILTSHVHDALRDYLGLANASTTAVFPFNNTEKFNFFG
jgi:uncharacterized protein (DUF1501 family)